MRCELKVPEYTYYGSFEEGLQSDRKAEYKYATGDTYNGSVKEGKFDGEGLLKLINGDYYEGLFKDGMKHGYGH